MHTRFAVALLMNSVPATTALAQANTAQKQPPAWWEVVVGIVGIPTAVLAVVGGFLLIRKTILETRKLELEIKKERNSLEKVSSEELMTASDYIKNLLDPLLETRRYFILMFMCFIWLVMVLLSQGLGSVLGSLYERWVELNHQTFAGSWLSWSIEIGLRNLWIAVLFIFSVPVFSGFETIIRKEQDRIQKEASGAKGANPASTPPPAI